MQVDVTENQLHVSHVESTKRDVTMACQSATVASKEALKTAVSITRRLSPNLEMQLMTRALENRDL
jgi:hypothetical protein